MDIAIMGYGGVGRALVELIHNKKDELENQALSFTIKYIFNSRGGIYDPEGIGLEDFIEFSKQEKDISLYSAGSARPIDFEDLIFNKDIDFLVEVTSTNLTTGQPGLNHIKRSLENGINVVTANKGPILLAYKELAQIAEKNGVQLGIGCTTGGALPSVNAGLIELAGSRVTSIEGILNGTTNFILEEMENNKIECDLALKKAQDLGIAERDPTMDVQGLDTASKLLILTNLLMAENKTMEDVELEGIDSLELSDIRKMASMNKRYKLIGRSLMVGDQVKISVKPELVGENDLFYNVGGKDKIVRYESDILGDLTIIGGASGVVPAAGSVLRDLINISRGYRYIT